MAEGSGYGGFSGVPYPYWLSPPSAPFPHHPASSAPPFLTSYPVESYDPTQGGFDPMISNGSYHRSPLSWSNSRHGNFGPRAEDSYKDLFPPSGFNSSRESSADFVPLPGANFLERQHLNFVPINSITSASVPSLAEMMFYKPTEPSGVYASLPGHCRPGYAKGLESMNVVPDPPVEPYTCVTNSIPTLPMSSLKTESFLSQTGVHSGEGRSFQSNNDICSHAPETLKGGQSSMYGSSVEPVNFDVLLGYNEATGHLSENPDLRFQITDSPGSRSPRPSYPLQLNIKPPGSLFKDKLEGSGVSSLYQRPYTLVADSANAVSESSLTNEIEDLNCDEHRSWNHFTVSSAPMMFSMGSESCAAMKSGNGNAKAVNCKAANCKAAFEGSANQRREDGEANQKPRKLHEERSDILNRDYKTSLFTNLGFNGSSRSDEDDVSTGRSPQKDLFDQGDFPSPTSSPSVSSVVNAMQNLSEVLVYECFNNGSCLKLEQLENLDKVVANLSKCLKKFTDNKTIGGESSLPTQAMHVQCPNVSEAPKEIAKDFQGFTVTPLDSSGFKEPVDKNEMTQSIKNILASNFPDGEENNPQTLLYKNLWLETEATLASTTCMARYHRIKNEIGSLKLHNKDISADGSTIMQEPSLNPHKSVPLMNYAEQEKTESPIKQGSNSGNDLETKSYDAPERSIFNSDQVDAGLSLLSRSFTGGFEQTIHETFKPDAATSVKIPDAIHQESTTSTTENKPNDVVDWFQLLKNQETKNKLKSENCPDDVIDRFQILKQQETKRKLKSQTFQETKVSDLENNPEDSETARFGRSSLVSDVMDRFQILKRREAEQVQKSLSSVETDSDSDNDQPRSNTPMKLASMIKELSEFNPQTERSIDAKASASGNGCESPTSDWEHVLRDG